MCDLYGWTNVQREIYANRLLRGSAKLLVNYEKCYKNWKTMKVMLCTEFAQKVDVYEVHKELSRRTKKETETYQEYVYKMLDIAKQVSMESSTVIKYIIDEIRDEETNKMILYSAEGIRELKEKLALYEAMKENEKTRGKQVEGRFKRTSRGGAVQERLRRCSLCGHKDHLNAKCPTESRCFKCQKYRYIVAKCNSLSKSPKDACNVSRLLQTKCWRDVKIGDCELIALIDTGSELALM
jgi:hypothetical protein